MTDHAAKQLAHFARIDHGSRYKWQTEDTFVVERELATLQPFIEALRVEQAKHGSLRILESGCGEGVNQAHLQMAGVTDVTIEGVDVSPEAVAEALRHGHAARVASGLALPYADATFDVVFCRDVLHHLANDAERLKFFEEMQRVCKPDGLIAAIEPNARNWMIWGLSVLVPAERGLRSIVESHLSKLLPGATIVRVAPSAVWRFFLSFKSPFRNPKIAPFVHAMLRFWEKLCQTKTPSVFWSYRVYIWRKRV